MNKNYLIADGVKFQLDDLPNYDKGTLWIFPKPGFTGKSYLGPEIVSFFLLK
jgi:hypothetical protein